MQRGHPLEPRDGSVSDAHSDRISTEASRSRDNRNSGVAAEPQESKLDTKKKKNSLEGYDKVQIANRFPYFPLPRLILKVLLLILILLHQDKRLQTRGPQTPLLLNTVAPLSR